MNSEIFNVILQWTLPPLLGAIIGYLTNDIAIKMLFRPLREIRIFGIRLPFTPGVIPRQRYVLAESIGNMVSQNLITADAIKEHVESPDFNESFGKTIERLTGSFLDTPVRGFNTPDLSFAYESFSQFLVQTLNRFFNSENFLASLDTIAGETVKNFSEKKIKDIFSQLNVREAISKYILPFISGQQLKSWLQKEIAGWVKDQMKKNTPLSTLVPPGIIDGAVAVLKSFLPNLTDAFFSWLKESPVKNEMETQGRKLLKTVLDKLNFFQRFVVTVAQYESTLNEKMPDIIEEIIDRLKQIAIDTERLDEFVQAIRSGIDQWMANGMFDLLFTEGIDVNEKIQILFDKLFDIIGSEETHQFLLASLDEILEKNEDVSLGRMAEEILGLERDKIIAIILEHMHKLVTSEKTAEILTRKIMEITSGILEKSQDVPLRELLGIQDDVKTRIDAFISKKIGVILQEKLPQIVEGFNVKQLVVNKINGLDVESVEKLLLMVIAKHLKWINVFGALLGAVIGFSQVLIKLFLP
ncbi:MAG: DUF445 family protein [Spirochaetales bacterium]|nr:DUF445 family protein [Spirochaetales bacterium]